MMQLCISIHALLAESDRRTHSAKFLQQRFLSTLSLRRATSAGAVVLLVLDDFYPRSPCGERPVFVANDVMGRIISIHALLAESDKSLR